jgi:hypothetical protein
MRRGSVTKGREFRWRQGLLRCWVLASVLWAVAVTVMMTGNMNVAWIPMSDQTVHIRISDAETWDYPASWGETRIREDFKGRFAEKTAGARAWLAQVPAARKVACEQKNWKNWIDDPECEKIFWLSASVAQAVPSGWESQLINRHISASQAVIEVLPWAAGPPLLVLILGSALWWAIAGFRPSSPAIHDRAGAQHNYPPALRRIPRIEPATISARIMLPRNIDTTNSTLAAIETSQDRQWLQQYRDSNARLGHDEIVAACEKRLRGLDLREVVRIEHEAHTIDERVMETMRVYRALLMHEHGHSVAAGYSERDVQNYGPREALIRTIRRRTQTDAMALLSGHNRLDCTYEQIAIDHASELPEDVVGIARQTLAALKTD